MLLKAYGFSEEKPYAFLLPFDIIMRASAAALLHARAHTEPSGMLEEEGSMACFLVPTAEAIVVTVATKIIQSKEKDAAKPKIDARLERYDAQSGIPFSRKLKWLSNLLWGGAVLLAFEHLWHGEVVPWFPFLTAASNPADTSVMLHEMSTVGVSMAVLVTAVWAGMVLVTNAMERKALKPQTAAK
jgi:hypothetical protein